MPDKIKVGMADWKLAHNPDWLVTYGLGSCVGLGLWDAKEQVAAMAHIMLPDSKEARFRQDVNPAKFADTAMDVMFDYFIRNGIPPERLQAKVVGGANMFAFTNRLTVKNGMNIGQRNVLAVHELLRKMKIRILGEDTGGTSGRSVEFAAESGVMRIRTALSGEHFL